MKKKLLFLTLLFSGSVISAFGQATGSWYTPTDVEALATGAYGVTGGSLAISTTDYRTGTQSLAFAPASTSSKYCYNNNIGILPGVTTGRIHLIYWAKASDAATTLTSTAGVRYNTSGAIGSGSSGSMTATTTTISSTQWTRCSGYFAVNNATRYYFAAPAFQTSTNTYTAYFDDFIWYYDASSTATTDLTEPEVAPSAVAGTAASLSWTNGSDAGTGVQGTLILGTNAASPTAIVNGTNLLDQGYYPAGATVATDWTVLTNISGASTTTYNPTTTYTTYAIINYDKAYNYSAATTYTPTATGVNLTKATAKVYTTNKTVTVEGNAGAKVSVVSVDGISLYSGVISSTKETLPLSLQTGVYAVIVNGVATKVFVK